MATFGKATYNAARYAAIRPTYPRQLYDFIFQYHERGPKARWGVAVDLGCGTGMFYIMVVVGCYGLTTRCPGQATRELTHFQKVIGVDPSNKMIEQASASETTGQVEFRQSSAEDLPFLEDGSVDLITSGPQSCRHVPH